MLIRPGMHLSTKIFLIALLNLMLIALVIAVFGRFQYRFDLQSFLISPAHDRILSTARQIALELRDTDRNVWDQLLQRYAAANKIELRLTDDDGRQIAGSAGPLPPAVLESLNHQSHDQTRNSPLMFLGTTRIPRKHWVGVRIPIPSLGERHHVHGVLIAASSSLIGTPFFFDARPWIAVAVTLVLISIVCWLPFGRRLMKSVSHMSHATAQIAEGQFRIQLPVTRHDELGQLSASINRMAARLDGFVAGQKRFLGDTAHELCSPIARMQVAISILERSAGSDQMQVIGDLHDDLEHMSKLVHDVLAFSKAGLLGPDVTLARTRVTDVVTSVLEREAVQSASIEIDIPSDLYVRANSELLERALANVIRNAIRYAGTRGPISITASSESGLAFIRIRDCGPGLPETDLDRVFDPFYRLEFSRGSDSGGVGLGLAIVKACIEACEGSVVCRNLSQGGLEVEIVLNEIA